MGKILIINGANFSDNALPAENIHTVGELLTYKGYVKVENGALTQVENSAGAWRCAILELQPGMYVENLTAVSTWGSTSSQVSVKIPPVIFLTSDQLSGYISGSEVYAQGSTTFATFSGVLNPPSSATYVVMNTNLEQGGSATSIISWQDE